MNAQTLQDVDWKLLHILDCRTNQSYSCRGRIKFNSDSTVSGFDGCNSIVSVFSYGIKRDISENTVSSYSLKGQDLLTIDKLYTTSVGCIPKDKTAVNVPELLHASLLKAETYKINADTLIIHCKNNVGLYYLKTK